MLWSKRFFSNFKVVQRPSLFRQMKVSYFILCLTTFFQKGHLQKPEIPVTYWYRQPILKSIIVSFYEQIVFFQHLHRASSGWVSSQFSSEFQTEKGGLPSDSPLLTGQYLSTSPAKA